MKVLYITVQAQYIVQIDTSKSLTTQRKPLKQININLSNNSLSRIPLYLLVRSICHCGTQSPHSIITSSKSNLVQLHKFLPLKENSTLVNIVDHDKHARDFQTNTVITISVPIDLYSDGLLYSIEMSLFISRTVKFTYVWFTTEFVYL